MEGVKCQQLYLPETNILLTRFFSVNGVAEITEFMPIKEVGTDDIIIKSFDLFPSFKAHFNSLSPVDRALTYARDNIGRKVLQHGALFQSQAFKLCLALPFTLETDGHESTATFAWTRPETVHFLLESTKADKDHLPKPLSEI